jgi:hypothetical protein
MIQINAAAGRRIMLAVSPKQGGCDERRRRNDP